jgi:hypothetical protein
MELWLPQQLLESAFQESLHINLCVTEDSHQADFLKESNAMLKLPYFL